MQAEKFTDLTSLQERLGIAEGKIASLETRADSADFADTQAKSSIEKIEASLEHHGINGPNTEAIEAHYASVAEVKAAQAETEKAQAEKAAPEGADPSAKQGSNDTQEASEKAASAS